MPTGITTFQTAIGPVFFAPAASPASAPGLPSGSEPDSDGNATKVPKSTVDDVAIKSVSSISFTIPSLAVNVATPSGPGTGTTVAKPVTVTITGDVNLEFPAKDL